MLADKLVTQLSEKPSSIVRLDLASGIALINEEWIQANWTASEKRSQTQHALLEESDSLISELEVSDRLVVALPIYNFGVPAAFKAWIDQITRSKKTFRYGTNGVEGLLKDRPTYVIVTSGGTKLNSELDFVSAWIKHVFNFVGISDSSIIDASGILKDEKAVLTAAENQILTMASR
jgi:FMN-dependent NADH-azoreductase